MTDKLEETEIEIWVHPIHNFGAGCFSIREVVLFPNKSHWRDLNYWYETDRIEIKNEELRPYVVKRHLMELGFHKLGIRTQPGGTP